MLPSIPSLHSAQTYSDHLAPFDACEIVFELRARASGLQCVELALVMHERTLDGPYRSGERVGLSADSAAPTHKVLIAPGSCT